MRYRNLRFLMVALLALSVIGRAPAQVDLEDLSFPEVFRGVNNATSITHAGDGSGRLFVTEQLGRVLVFDGESLLESPFLDIRDRVRAGGERGLLSVAFHPRFIENGSFFVNYTDQRGDTVVSRFEVTDDPNIADAASESILFRAAQPRRNHNGGQIQFGPDGYLYIGMGDGGGAGDPPNLAQDLSSVLGKILRVDVDCCAPRLAPASNPFVNRPRVRPEIWAYGLRNPWRFSFDRQTGDMFIGDVGQNRSEEISMQPATSLGGENYGWRLMEGSRCFNPPANCDDGTLVLPILEYDNLGGNCGGSVTGGYRYRGHMFPRLSGIYFFADYCTGDFFAGVESDGAWTRLGPRETSFGIRTFGEDEDGEIYFADSSVVYRIEVSRPPPQISESGVVSAASFEVGSGLAPGSLATAFGVGLASAVEAATGLPLPNELGGGSMTFNGTLPAPQIFASPGQRNFQLPWELNGLSEARVSVTVGNETSPDAVVPLASASPAVFTLNESGQAAALIALGPQVIARRGRGFAGPRVVAAPVGGFGGSRPARAGEVLEIFATGLGPVTNPPQTGAGALAYPVSVTVEPVSVRIGDEPMRVLFAGLAPAFVGLNQVNVELVGQIASGDAVPLVVEVADVESNKTFVAIE